MTTIGAQFAALATTFDQATPSRWRWVAQPRLQQILLVAADAITLALVAGVTLFVSPLSPLASGAAPTTPVTLATVFIFAAWLGGLAWSGTYAIRHLRAGATEYKRLVTASVTVAGVVGITCYLVGFSYPRTMFVSWFVAGTLAMIVSRFVRRQTMHRLHLRGMLQTRVLVAGADHHVDAVARVLRREQWLGYQVMGAATRERQATTSTGLPVVGTLDTLRETVERLGVDTVIFAEGSFDNPAEFRRLAWTLEERDIQMIVVPTVADVSSQRLEVRPVAGLPLLDVDRPHAIAAGRWIKRAFDVVGAALLLLLSSPILLLTALAIKVEDGGPIIFRQRRVGLKGEEFNMLKFRSMCVDAEAKLAELQAKNEGAGVLFKIANDPRVTRVGRFIRRFSIDELPQLWNAFRGDMSLVGPRPALPREVAQYDSDTMRRLDVRPGLTGLWQVSGRSNLSWEDTVRLDLYYVDNWSMVQDLMILVKTARAVVGRDGAY